MNTLVCTLSLFPKDEFLKHDVAGERGIILYSLK